RRGEAKRNGQKKYQQEASQGLPPMALHGFLLPRRCLRIQGPLFPRQAGLIDWRLVQETKGNNAMNVTIGLEEIECLSWDVSDEALEIAGAGNEVAGGYTLQFCTSMDCALVS